MRAICLLLLPLALAACATAGSPSGELSSYQGLQVKDGTMRTGISRRADDAALAKIARIAIAPTRIADRPETRWLSEADRRLLLREIDAQLCFELTERYELAPAGASADAEIRTVVTRVAPTNPAGSAIAAAGSFFIPGPIGVRVPGAVGGLGAEAEMLTQDGRQVAALVWNRNAAPIGTDDPSLSRIGDALQFAEPFGDTVGAVMSAEGRKRKPGDPDPCAAYGPRFRPEGWLAKFATGLYIPQASGAKADKTEAPR